MANRKYMRNALTELGFRVLPSSTNFLFAKYPDISGQEMYEELKKRGILVRHFDQDRIRGYNRITVGTKEEVDRLVRTVKEVIDECKDDPEQKGE